MKNIISILLLFSIGCAKKNYVPAKVYLTSDNENEVMLHVEAKDDYIVKSIGYIDSLEMWYATIDDVSRSEKSKSKDSLRRIMDIPSGGHHLVCVLHLYVEDHTNILTDCDEKCKNIEGELEILTHRASHKPRDPRE